MKKTLIALTLLFGIVGCSPPATETQQQQPVAVESTTSSEQVDQMYVKLIREQTTPEFTQGVTDAEIVDMGKTTCLAIEAQGGVENFIHEIPPELYGTAADSHNIGVVIGASVVSYCPEYIEEIENFK